MRTTSQIAFSFLALLASGCSAKIAGKADVTTKEHGNFSVQPSECSSGERQDFFGADLREGSGDKIIRLINDPTNGYAVKINIPGTKKAVVVNDKVCTTFDVHVEKQNSTINDIRNVKGHVKIDCVVEGSTAKADVTFENCH